MTPSGPKWVGVGSVRVRYYDEGQGETVLLLHGLGGFAEHWWKNIDPLSRRFRVIAPDIVGFGLTDKPKADYTLGYFVEFVSAFVNALGIAQTAIIGTSLGGAVAMQRALSDPGSVRKLVLVASVGLAERAGGFIRSLLLPIAESLSIRPSRWMLKFGYRHVVHRYRPDYGVLIERHHDVMRSADAQRVFYEVSRRLIDADAYRQGYLLLGRLCEIRIPVLLIAGREDRVIPLTHSVRARKYFPEASLVEVKDCGHMPYLEKPGEFNSLVINFLEN